MNGPQLTLVVRAANGSIVPSLPNAVKCANGGFDDTGYVFSRMFHWDRDPAAAAFEMPVQMIL